MNIINISNKHKVKKFIFASSSSVYGDKRIFPLKENMNILPKNIYSATKINEDIVYDISRISNMKIIGLRFLLLMENMEGLDMFIFKFLNALINRKNFIFISKGNHHRDYTHIDDVVNIVFSFNEKKNF